MSPAPTAPSTRVEPAPWMRRLAWATLAVNVLIVVTGGVVRLTGSGLGCPTWPQCTGESFTPHGAMGIHAAIEFGNRTITFLLAAVAIATYVVARRDGRTRVRRLAFWLGLSVPAQAVLGGITVLTDLNPWVVGGHMMFSLVVIAGATSLLRAVDEADGPARVAVPDLVRTLTLVLYAVGWVVLYLGTIVTGSGPHAGDADAPRNGLDPESFSQLHTDVVFLFLGLTVALVLVLRTVEAPERARRASVLLLGLLLAQGAVGFVQYFSGLPVALVTLHLLGAALTSAAMTWLLLGTRER